jgi:transposase
MLPRCYPKWNLGDIYAGGGYRGELKERVKSLLKCDLHIILRKKTKKFIPLPKRWVVERTFAWPLNSRRLAIDFEFKTCSAEAIVKI